MPHSKPPSTADHAAGRRAGQTSATPDATPRVRRELLRFLRESGVAPADLERIELCVSEAVTNVVLHAYPPDAPGPVRWSAELTPEALVLVVADDGGGIRADVPSPGVGAGLRLIAVRSDDLTIAPGERGGLVVTMRFVRG